MQLDPQQHQIIKNCQQSVSWFLRNFGKVRHPSAGMLSFDPFKYQKNALRNFREHRLNIFKKCRQCFVGESMVWTPSGPRRIDSIRVGDLIYSYNPVTGLLEIVPVLATYDNGERDCVNVLSKTGHTSIATNDHLYFTTTGGVKAEELTQADTLLEVNEPERYSMDIDESEAILLGYLITDGHYGRRVHFTNTCWKYLLEVQKHFQKRFGRREKIVPHHRDENNKIVSWRIWLNGPEIRNWLTSLRIYGQTRHNKILPESVFRWSNKSLATLLNRIFAADGWYSGSHCNEAGVCSESLITLNQIKQLLSRFSIDSKVYPATARGMPKLRLYGSTSFDNFYHRIGIYGKKPRCPLTRGFFFNRYKGEIKSVKPAGKRRVYDLKVPPYDNYIVDGAVVHNSGASSIAGAYSLWFTMFFPLKTVLIVSRTDADAMKFLADNIKFLFQNLPDWMQELWDPKPYKDNEHELEFPNGSRIRSLSSNQDVLRSNASSLNIIDEAAFIPSMDEMWAAGWPTLMHGGSVIVVSTTNGMGGWYWSTWTDAEIQGNDFNAININWWDMDWAIEYIDSASGRPVRIAPVDGILTCKGQTILDSRFGEVKLEKEKYGPYWSPWLEEQYRALQAKGEAWKFEQEILASFVGSGNTVLDKAVLYHIGTTVRNPEVIITGPQSYIHPVSGEVDTIDYTPQGPAEGLWIWKKPILAVPAKYRGKDLVRAGSNAHVYAMGVDISTGKSRDYHSIEIFDIQTMEQVAEYMGHCLPRVFKKIVDRVGRWYNCAMAAIERNNGGDTFIDEMRYDLMYPRLWRKHDIDDRPKQNNANPIRLSQYGFFTSTATKPTLNKFLIDFLRDRDGEGYTIYSKRLHKQLQTYVRKRDKAGKDTGKTEAEDGAANFDDLVMSCGLALIAAPDAVYADTTNLIPMGSADFTGQTMSLTDLHKKFADIGGPGVMAPLVLPSELGPSESIQAQLEHYALQLGGIPLIDRNLIPAASVRKHSLNWK